jgi:hypothetical protein
MRVNLDLPDQLLLLLLTCLAALSAHLLQLPVTECKGRTTTQDYGS